MKPPSFITKYKVGDLLKNECDYFGKQEICILLITKITQRTSNKINVYHATFIGERNGYEFQKFDEGSKFEKNCVLIS